LAACDPFHEALGEVSVAGWVADYCMSDLRPALRQRLRRSALSRCHDDRRQRYEVHRTAGQAGYEVGSDWRVRLALHDDALEILGAADAVAEVEKRRWARES